MSLKTSVIAAITVTALIFCAGAIPACAGTSPSSPPAAHRRTSLLRAIVAAQPGLREDITHATAAFAGRDGAALVHAATAVAHLHADHAQRAAQVDWVQGVRAERTGDLELAVAASETAGRPSTAREREEVIDSMARADEETAHADALLGLHISPPVRVRSW